MDLEAESLETGQYPTSNTRYSGIVDTYINVGRRNSKARGESDAMKYLRHELYDHYHFGDPKKIPCFCPRNDCGLEFKTATE